MSWIRSPKDFWAGLMFIAFGVAAMVLSTNYSMGVAARMGPGYFPRGLGGLLTFLGVIITIKGLRDAGEPVPQFFFKPLLLVLVPVVAFGLLVPYIGTLIGSSGLIFGVSMAHHEFRWQGALISGVVVAISSVAIFILGLGVQLPIWPEFVYSLWPTTFHR
jgi:hypothetical protein